MHVSIVREGLEGGRIALLLAQRYDACAASSSFNARVNTLASEAFVAVVVQANGEPRRQGKGGSVILR
jgi:hypothetical protein